MNGRSNWLVVGVLCMLAASAPAQPSGKSVEQIVGEAAATLARVEYTYENEFVGSRPQAGQCICIDAANGVFLTRDIPVTIPPDEMKDFFLFPAGSADTKIKAEYMGTDPEESISFLRVAPEPDPKKAPQHKWKQASFVRTDLRLGQEVLSVGLLSPSTGNTPYMGAARVAAKLLLPNEMIYVSGGELTNSSSPVMTTDGRVVGMVGGQIPMDYQMVLRGRPTDIGLASVQTGRFFLPVAEFAHVLGRIPRDGTSRRLPWMGIWTYKQVTAVESSTMGLADRPAVLVGQVMVGGAANKAGIKQTDAIVGLNGKPLPALGTPALVARGFQRELNRFNPDDTISITIFRDRKETTVTLKLDTMPIRPYEAARIYDVQLGFAGRDIVPFERYANRPTPLARCVLITVVRPNTPAAMGKLQPGDLVLRVADKPTPDVEAMKGVLKGQAGAKESVPFMVQRGEDREVLSIKMPKE